MFAILQLKPDVFSNCLASASPFQLTFLLSPSVSPSSASHLPPLIPFCLSLPSASYCPLLAFHFLPSTLHLQPLIFHLFPASISYDCPCNLAPSTCFCSLPASTFQLLPPLHLPPLHHPPLHLPSPIPLHYPIVHLSTTVYEVRPVIHKLCRQLQCY